VEPKSTMDTDLAECLEGLDSELCEQTAGESWLSLLSHPQPKQPEISPPFWPRLNIHLSDDYFCFCGLVFGRFTRGAIGVCMCMCVCVCVCVCMNKRMVCMGGFFKPFVRFSALICSACIFTCYNLDYWSTPIYFLLF